jgi:hypothetical protein
MRLAILGLALLAIVCAGPSHAVAQEVTATVPVAPYVTTVPDQPAVVTPVRWYTYRPAPSYGYYSYRPYYTYRPYYSYRPHAYWYGAPRYYNYYAAPYRTYYYPNNFGFEYRGPRRAFYFSF